MKLKNTINTKFCLMGAGFHLCYLAQRLVELGFPKPLIITYPRTEHERDNVLLKNKDIYTNVFDVTDELGLEVWDINTVNNEKIINKVKSMGYEAIFSLSWRQRISKEFIDAFDGLVFNIHPSMLPKERGSGTFSYRILNSSNEISATLHMVDPGLDTGHVIIQKQKILDIEKPIPKDFLTATNKLYIEILNEFLDWIKSSQEIQLIEQDETQNTYLPLLHTETNGAINWDWNIKEVERFIRAFSTPYPGAFTYINGEKIVIREAEIIESETNYHSYLNGRVISVQPDGTVDIILNGGILKIHSILYAHEVKKPSGVIKHYSILSTPHEILHSAKNTVLRANQMNVPTQKVEL